MAIGNFREHVYNNTNGAWPPQRWPMKILEVAVRMTLLLVIVGLLALFVGSPNDRPIAKNTTPSAWSGSEPTASVQSEKKQPRAISVIRPIGNSGVTGFLQLINFGGEIEIRGVIEGLAPGKHGFHIHEFGDLSDSETGKSVGGHFNPTNQPHGRRDAKQRHVGDLGNIEADNNGMANVSIRDSVIQLDGPHSIIGRSIVIHAGADKFTQPAGDAGARVAFGVIGSASCK